MTKCEFSFLLEQHEQELKQLYMELYGNETMYDSLVAGMKEFADQRSSQLKQRDAQKGGTDWYKSGDLLGMMLYIDNFAGDLKGVREKIGYLEKANVNYILQHPCRRVTKRSVGSKKWISRPLWQLPGHPNLLLCGFQYAPGQQECSFSDPSQRFLPSLH